jgi:hypothetical protein
MLLIAALGAWLAMVMWTEAVYELAMYWRDDDDE